VLLSAPPPSTGEGGLPAPVVLPLPPPLPPVDVVVVAVHAAVAVTEGAAAAEVRDTSAFGCAQELDTRENHKEIYENKKQTKSRKRFPW
jgi:hypothetical protein